jgi:hypothetical protein
MILASAWLPASFFQCEFGFVKLYKKSVRYGNHRKYYLEKEAVVYGLNEIIIVTFSNGQAYLSMSILKSGAKPDKKIRLCRSTGRLLFSRQPTSRALLFHGRKTLS